MRVNNMVSTKGNKSVNQFIISDGATETLQSYDRIIAKRTVVNMGGIDRAIKIELDKTYWDYSVTAGKYRNQFLGENKAETQKKIDSGDYVLVDLN